MATCFISFRESDVDPSKLRTICSTYVEYQWARTVRQRLIRRLLLFLLGIAGLTLGFHVLPTVALVTTAMLSTGGTALCVRTELKARRRFIEELRDVPAADPLKTG